jgi:hypothetical protein
MLEKTIYWCCVTILISFGAVSCWGVIDAVTLGRIETIAKSGPGTVYVLAQNPAGFLSALGVHLFIAGFFWFAAFWVWRIRIRNEAV